MHISDRFQSLVRQQLASYQSTKEIKNLIVYVANAREGEEPSLEPISIWPSVENALPPSVESDPELRMPSSSRRWYPLQEGSILLGVLRVEKNEKEEIWPERLDQMLKSTAFCLGQCLGLELERSRLSKELNSQRDQISLMVHQLRNPLAALRTYAQLLMRKLGPESLHSNLVQGLLTEQDQLNRYISVLDDMGESKLPSAELIPSPLLLPPVLSKGSYLTVKKLIEPLLARAAVTASFKERIWQGPSVWPEWAKQTRSTEYGIIAEIVANLLENAFRYSQIGSSVGIYFTDSGLCVWDSGKPIDSNERDLIFKRGVRGDEAKEFSGSGLGLALGRELSRKIGGDLDLVIPPKNIHHSLPARGNAFVLTIPIR